MSTNTDELLQQRLREHDPHALGQLYDRLGQRLHAYLVAFCACRDLADEALQEAFISFATQGEKLAAAANLDAYCFTVARNAALQLLRRRPRYAASLELVESADSSELNSSNHQPKLHQGGSQELIDRETLQLLEGALASLPSEQREVVALKIWEGMTFAAIAELLGVSANTAASRYRYAMDKLRVELRSLSHVS